MSDPNPDQPQITTSSDQSSQGLSLADLREPAPPVAGGEASQISMPGAIDPALASASGAQATSAGSVNADATGYNAQTGEVDPSTMTAAGQLNQITSLDSANMRRAANQGMLTAARRGLQNSSFAAGAAQGAMVDRATPLAQQDAATYFQNMRANLDATNRAAEVSTGRETDVSALNSQLEQQVNLANADAENRMAELNAQLDTAVSQQNADMINRIQSQMQEIEAGINTRNAELSTQVSMANADSVNRMNQQVLAGYQSLNEQYLRGEQAVDLAAIQGRYQQLISSNNAAASIYQTYMSSIGQAMANHEVTPQRIAQYVNVMAQQLEGSLELIDAMNGLNLGGETNVPGAGSVGSGTNSSVFPTPPAGSGADGAVDAAGGVPGTPGQQDPNNPEFWGPDEWLRRFGSGLSA
jgi:hypothetical protein